MARKPRASTAKKAETASTPFIEALKFISIVTKDQGSVNETHVFLGNSCAIAFNGILAAGIRLTEDIYACPHNGLLLKALSKCSDNLSITQMDSSRLAIKSGKFKAIVPCIDPSMMALAQPDNPVVPITDIIKKSLSICNMIDIEESQDLISNSILMNGGSFISSNRKVIIEHWHGLNLPSGILLPKTICDALNKCAKPIVSFGYSDISATFWFEDGSWIRTQLVVGNWPDLKGILDKPSNPWSTPTELFEALQSIAPFSDNGLVYFDAGLIKTHTTEGMGATYEVHGIPKGPVFSIKQLMMLKTIATKIDFNAQGPYEGTTALKFFGDNIRGGIAGRIESRTHLDDDIPF